MTLLNHPPGDTRELPKFHQEYHCVVETRKCADRLIERPTPPPAELKPAEGLLTSEEPIEVLHGKWRCGFKVTTLSTLTLEQASILLDFRRDKQSSGPWYEFTKPEALMVELTYPLGKVHQFALKPMRVEVFKDGEHVRTNHRFTEGYVLWAIAQEYLYIYERHEEYGVWGHDIGDLFIESVEIDTNGFTSVGIGS